MSTAVATWVGGVPLDPGTRLVVDNADYMYGLGRVHVIVREVLGVVEHDGEEWVDLEAEQVVMGGVRIPRWITIRIQALRDGARRAGGIQ